MRCSMPARLALRRDQVIPAARRRFGGVNAEDPVCQRVAQMVVEKQPAVELLIANFLLNFCEFHG